MQTGSGSYKLKEEFIMAQRICPNCQEVVDAKALPDYRQINFRDIPVKQRKVIHKVSDGGCGHSWYTIEIPKDVLIREE